MQLLIKRSIDFCTIKYHPSHGPEVRCCSLTNLKLDSDVVYSCTVRFTANLVSLYGAAPYLWWWWYVDEPSWSLSMPHLPVCQRCHSVRIQFVVLIWIIHSQFLKPNNFIFLVFYYVLTLKNWRVIMLLFTCCCSLTVLHLSASKLIYLERLVFQSVYFGPNIFSWWLCRKLSGGPQHDMT